MLCNSIRVQIVRFNKETDLSYAHRQAHTLFPLQTKPLFLMGIKALLFDGAPARGGSTCLSHRDQELLSGRTLILLPGDAARRGPVDLPGRKQIHRHRSAAVGVCARTGPGVGVRVRWKSAPPDSSSVRSRRHRLLSAATGRCDARWE